MITSAKDEDMIKLDFFTDATNGLELLKTFYVNKDVRMDDLMFIIPRTTCEVWITHKKNFSSIEFPKRVTATNVAEKIKDILTKVHNGCEDGGRGTQRRLFEFCECEPRSDSNQPPPSRLFKKTPITVSYYFWG